jgi:hypothetical protein
MVMKSKYKLLNNCYNDIVKLIIDPILPNHKMSKNFTTTAHLCTGGLVRHYTGGSRNRLWCTALWCKTTSHAVNQKPPVKNTDYRRSSSKEPHVIDTHHRRSSSKEPTAYTINDRRFSLYRFIYTEFSNRYNTQNFQTDCIIHRFTQIIHRLHNTQIVHRFIHIHRFTHITSSITGIIHRLQVP